jgi:hypothetical protein
MGVGVGRRRWVALEQRGEPQLLGGAVSAAIGSRPRRLPALPTSRGPGGRAAASVSRLPPTSPSQLCQNADDARATRVAFVLDRRSFPKGEGAGSLPTGRTTPGRPRLQPTPGARRGPRRLFAAAPQTPNRPGPRRPPRLPAPPPPRTPPDDLLGPGLAGFQGPALLAYNDATFRRARLRRPALPALGIGWGRIGLHPSLGPARSPSVLPAGPLGTRLAPAPSTRRPGTL